MGYTSPTSLADALAVLASGQSRILAGGTDVYPSLRDRPAQGAIVDITRVDGLRGIARTGDGGWRIGAATTWTDIVRADLPAGFDGLKAASREVGSIQVQNTGTVAGNLCNASPAADGVPPLLTLDASVELASVNGQRVLPLSAFITGPRQTALRPGEMVTAVLVPNHDAAAQTRFSKLGARTYLVISIAMAATLVIAGPDGGITEARVAVGSCSPVAVRLHDLERDLIGKSLADGSAAACIGPQHLAALAPIDDIRGSAAYRLTAVQEVLRRLLSPAAGAEIAA